MISPFRGSAPTARLGQADSSAEYSGRLCAELVAEEWQHVVRLRIPAEHRLREDELTVDVHVEDPVRARHDLDGTDRLLPLLEDPRRQTGGVRKRSSGDAVLDADVVTLRHSLHSFTPLTRYAARKAWRPVDGRHVTVVRA